MKADPLSLFEEFIKGAIGSQYVIPVYQRNYTWKKHKQVQQLLEDIKKILNHETSRHFLGSIVYVITKTDFIVREREVVDGQQRLVTMFLMTYALKEIAFDNGDTQISDYLVHNYLENNEAGEYKYRLRPSVSDDDAYEYIATDRVSEYEGSSLIMENYKYIKSVLAGLVATHTLMEVINLYYFMDGYVEELRKQSIGGVIKYIKLGNLTNALIELPDVETQKAIVKVLSKSKDILSFRQQQLQKLDELVKSRFIELFGDPKLNPRKWDMVTIGDIATDVRYGTSRPATDGGKYPYLRMNNLTYEGYLDLTDLKHIDVPDNEIEKCVVRNGDVLFNRTNSVELVGKTCVYNLDSDMIIAGYIIRVRIDDRVLPVILSSYLNSTVMKEQLRSMAKGAVNQANINAQELRSIPIYLPPITLQHEFATFVEQVDKSKIAVQQALDKAQELFDSLMQKYFG